MYIIGFCTVFFVSVLAGQLRGHMKKRRENTEKLFDVRVDDKITDKGKKGTNGEKASEWYSRWNDFNSYFVYLKYLCIHLTFTFPTFDFSPICATFVLCPRTQKYLYLSLFLCLIITSHLSSFFFFWLFYYFFFFWSFHSLDVQCHQSAHSADVQKHPLQTDKNSLWMGNRWKKRWK